MAAINQLKESKRLLDKTRQELVDSYEQSQVPRLHTFLPLAGYFPRDQEEKVINNLLKTQPAFIVLFGSSSTGKTALVRQVLSDTKQYNVIHFDLRIGGFADPESLFISFARQFEQFFQTMIDNSQGGSPELRDRYVEQFSGHLMGFRQARKRIENRVEKSVEMTGNKDHKVVNSGDLAALMELFQSSLVAYWEFDPFGTKLDAGNVGSKSYRKLVLRRSRLFTDENHQIPVIMLDEAHRLPQVIKSEEMLRTLLDAFLVLTKQDRLCHIIQATSDPFYMHWLQEMKLLHHVKIITIDDPDKEQTRRYYENFLIPETVGRTRSPGALKYKLPKFDEVWEFFGGRLSHISDYISQFIDSGGTISPAKSSDYSLAYTSLKLCITHPAILKKMAPNMGQVNPEVILKILRELIFEAPNCSLDYFYTCEKYGVETIDGLINAKLLNIWWTPPLSATDSSTVNTNSSLRSVYQPKLVFLSPLLKNTIRSVLDGDDKPNQGLLIDTKN